MSSSPTWKPDSVNTYRPLSRDKRRPFALNGARSRRAAGRDNRTPAGSWHHPSAGGFLGRDGPGAAVACTHGRHHRPAPAGRCPFPALARAGTQIGLFLLAYLVYSAARWLTIGDLGAAKANADWIVDFEDNLGVGIEASVQPALTGTGPLGAQPPLPRRPARRRPRRAVFLYRRSRPLYARLRNTMLATWLISMPVYGLFPVAPPRLAGIGLVDTISTQTGFAMDSKLTTSFYNELAAVPSLHVGFAVAVGIAIAAAVRNRSPRSSPCCGARRSRLAVVATGNHFVFDIVAGLLASALGYAAGIAVTRVPLRRTGERARPKASAPARRPARGFGDALPEAA